MRILFISNFLLATTVFGVAQTSGASTEGRSLQLGIPEVRDGGDRQRSVDRTKIAAADDFPVLYAKWEELRTSIHLLDQQYNTAGTPENLDALKTQYANLLRLKPKALAAATDAWIHAPDTYPAAAKFLHGWMCPEFTANNYAEALDLAKTLLANPSLLTGDQRADALKVAAISSFNLNHFHEAVRFWKIRQALGPLDDGPARLLQASKEYVVFWDREEDLQRSKAHAPAVSHVEFRTTAGKVVIELFRDEAPVSVNEFLRLVSGGDYDGVKCENVLLDTAVAIGSRRLSGSRGFDSAAHLEADSPNHRIQFRGSVSIVTADDDADSSQIRISFVPFRELNGKSTVFGRVTEGLDDLDSSIHAPTNMLHPDEPVVVIQEAKVRAD